MRPAQGGTRGSGRMSDKVRGKIRNMRTCSAYSGNHVTRSEGTRTERLMNARKDIQMPNLRYRLHASVYLSCLDCPINAKPLYVTTYRSGVGTVLGDDFSLFGAVN